MKSQPGFIQCPRAIHLHMRVVLGWPGPDRVEVEHERERLTGDVVTRPETGEVDIGAGEAKWVSASVITRISIWASV